MSKVSVVARVKAKEGKGEELVAAFRPVLEQAEKEPGTQLYILHRSNDDPDLFCVCELYADDEAFAAHSTSDAMAEAAPALGKVIAESELIVGEPLSAKGMPA